MTNFQALLDCAAAYVLWRFIPWSPLWTLLRLRFWWSVACLGHWLTESARKKFNNIKIRPREKVVQTEEESN